MTRIYGSPGTGKTTFLINKLCEEIENGVNIDDVCFTTFTKTAGKSARKRVCDELGLEYRDVLYFSNFHSLCFRLLNMDRKDVISDIDRIDFCEKYGYAYNPKHTISDNDELIPMIDTQTEGNALFSIAEQLRTRTMKLKDWVYIEVDNPNLDDAMVDSFVRSWKEYKEKIERSDFTDMVERTIEYKLSPPCSVHFYDEFQDTYPLLHVLYRSWIEDADRVYSCGDPYQTLYSYMGAVPESIFNEKADETIILPKTYRVPTYIWDCAKSLIYRHTDNYYDIDSVEPVKKGGLIRTSNLPDSSLYSLEGTTFALCRTWRQVKLLANDIMKLGVPFNILGRSSVWSPKFVSIYNALLKYTKNFPMTLPDVKNLLLNIPQQKNIKRGIKTKLKKEKIVLADVRCRDIRNMFLIRNISASDMFNILKINPAQRHALKYVLERGDFIENIRLSLGVIHSAKGLEADNVLLFNNINKRIAYNINQSRKHVDEEIRVFFTGITRSKSSLYVIDGYFGDYRFPYKLDEYKMEE